MTQSILAIGSAESTISHDNIWTNYNNIPFYEEAAYGLLENLAIQGGLNKCCDLELIKPYIINTSSILEVGAGYGRVIEYLLANNFKGKLSAIERGMTFCEIIKNKFHNNINLFQADLLTFQTKEKFQTILWLWSGIADFSKKEQLATLYKLFSFLCENGLLIIDNIPHSVTPLKANSTKKQHINVRLGKENSYLYNVSSEEIIEYAKKIKAYVKIINYKTNTGRNRIIYLLSRKKNVLFL